MSNILIIGNVIKDVYLRLDESTNHLESDQNHTPWLDLAFNGSTHQFMRRTSIYGGAAITLEILAKFGLRARIAGVRTRLADGGVKVDPDSPHDYRYILSTADTFNTASSSNFTSSTNATGTANPATITHNSADAVTYFTPTQRLATPWEMPVTSIDWILVDRSAQITDTLAHQIINYLSLAQDTRLAVYANPQYFSAYSNAGSQQLSTYANTQHQSAYANPPQPHRHSTYTNNPLPDNSPARHLLHRADLIFTDQPLPGATGFCCQISRRAITLAGEQVAWDPDRADLFTHLTTNSIIAATVFAALLKGKSNLEALQFAKVNVENSTLSGTLDYNIISEKVKDDTTSQVDIASIARALVAPGKGILAADESGGSIHKKFEAAGIPDDESHRRDYRNLFFTTPDLEKYVTGVILFDETARQRADDGRDFTSFLSAKGIIPGIKVDQGLVKFPNSTETWTDGLTGLDERLKEYYNMGLRFAKWRAAFEITLDPAGRVLTPTPVAIQKNCEILARYALACQAAGIVPIVEPEVVHDGDYSVEICARVTETILRQLFEELSLAKVDLKGCLLKCNMVLAGKRYRAPSTPAEVGRWTAQVLRAAVPRDLAGVVFLSGGQSVAQATENLQAVTNCGPYPWPVTFSYARALQGPALDAWGGNNAHADAARTAFRQRLVANTAALKKSA